MQVRKNYVAIPLVFPMICGSGKSKSRLAKAAGAAPSGQMREEQLIKIARRCGREARLKVKKLKTPHVRSTFGSWAVEKVHAFVARSTFPCQNVQSTSVGPLL